jgi:hypothetical protein
MSHVPQQRVRVTGVVRERILDTVTEAGKTRARWSGLLAVAALAWAGGSFLAVRYLDVIIAAFGIILGFTLLVVAFLARDWDSHSTYEERENARARRRKEKWERAADARARDRERWEAHQARQAKRADAN